MPRPKKGEEKGGPTRIVGMRLGADIEAKLDALAAFYAAEDGGKGKWTRTETVRRLIEEKYADTHRTERRK